MDKLELINVDALQSKNFVFLSEAGSGKTEVSLALAAYLEQQFPDKEVHYFDLDQTKPLLRGRDLADKERLGNFTIHYQEQVFDAPVVAAGVITRLRDPNSITLLDIGGGDYGSHMIGQFAGDIRGTGSHVFYLLNQYRAWSDSKENILQTLYKVTSTAGVGIDSVIANPNLGLKTTVDDVINGVEQVRKFDIGEISFCCAREEIAGEVSERLGMPVLPLGLQMTPVWMKNRRK